MKVKERKNYREVELFVDNDTAEEDDKFFYQKLTVKKEHSKFIGSMFAVSAELQISAPSKSA